MSQSADTSKEVRKAEKPTSGQSPIQSRPLLVFIFDYRGAYEGKAPEAYETLLLDVMMGDQTLFMRGDQVEAAWALLMPILRSWEERSSMSFPNYSAGSWGPEVAEALIAKDGFHWFSLPTQNEEHHD